jgi:hypothetical protein
LNIERGRDNLFPYSAPLRIEVFTGTARRRRLSAEDKVRIVAASHEGSCSGLVARFTGHGALAVTIAGAPLDHGTITAAWPTPGSGMPAAAPGSLTRDRR